MRIQLRAAILAAPLLLPAVAAQAHITLEQGQAAPGSSYKAVLRVGHGCDGSATTSISVEIPEGFIGAKPMPKPGWTLKTVSGPYKASYDSYGSLVASGVTTITWSGGSLPDDYYDEFVFRGAVAKEVSAAALYFPVVQQCETGANRWVEIPAAGQDAHGLKEPAPELRLVAAAGAPAAIKVGALTITRPWARATPGGAEVAGGYLRIDNAGKEADRLVGGTADISGAVEFHEMKVEDGIMTMRELSAGLEIPPGGSVELKPGGLHAMFTHLKGQLKPGGTFKAILTFEKAGPVALEFSVEPIGATAPAAGGHEGH